MPKLSYKEEKIKHFDPNQIALPSNNIFGLPFTTAESDIVIIPVPWEVTVSYRKGTAQAPQRVREAAMQVDLYNPDLPDFGKKGISLEPVSKHRVAMNKKLCLKAEKYLDALSTGKSAETNPTLNKVVQEINTECRKLHSWVREEVLRLMEQGKMVALLGGEHSTALGMIEALTKHYKSFGILQIDAHHDLRSADEGFTFSHASIMYNALQLSQVTKLTAVGVRDYSENEASLVKNSRGRISAFYDKDMAHSMGVGTSWKKICKEIVETLPKKVYVSFDIDGLDQKNCPNTGTPVVGGLEFEQALYLIEEVIESGRKIIGFDLNEVGDGEWDANVGARLLYRLSALFAKSVGKV